MPSLPPSRAVGTAGEAAATGEAALGRSLAGAAGRAYTLPSHLPSPQIVFVKVPKTASTSLQLDLAALGLDAGGVGQGERCFDDLYSEDAFSMTMLRSPRQHVLSLYLECNCSNWAKLNWKDMQPPFPAARTSDDLEGFGAWLYYFSQMRVNNTLVELSRVRNQGWRWFDDWKWCVPPHCTRG